MIRAAYDKLSASQVGIIYRMLPCRAAYDKLCRLAGRHTINYAALSVHIIIKPWASSRKYQNQKVICLIVPSAIANKLVNSTQPGQKF